MDTNVHSTTLQRILDSAPVKAKVAELEEIAKRFLESLPALASPVIDLLKKAPVLPEGVVLHESTGVISAKLAHPVFKCAFKIRAYNDSGEVISPVVLSAKGQTAPSGLTYEASLPPPSVFSIPPQSTGLLVVGKHASIQTACGHRGTPPGVFTISPPLPDGLSLDPQSGEISGTPSRPAARRDYVISVGNLAGKSECTISLEVQGHTQPVAIAYGTDLRIDAKIHAIFVVGKVVEMMLAGVDMANHLIFDVSPDLPAGLSLDRKTGCITGTPSTATGKVVYTITARNLQGETSTKIALAVSDDWQGSPPRNGARKCARNGSWKSS